MGRRFPLAEKFRRNLVEMFARRNTRMIAMKLYVPQQNHDFVSNAEMTSNRNNAAWNESAKVAKCSRLPLT
jgi:hypothetical protein